MDRIIVPYIQSRLFIKEEENKNSELNNRMYFGGLPSLVSLSGLLILTLFIPNNAVSEEQLRKRWEGIKGNCVGKGFEGDIRGLPGVVTLHL
jgi:hypothetical protein